MNFKEVVESIREDFNFKDVLGIGDNAIRLVEDGDNVNVMFCRVLDIVRDTSKKNEWWHVTFAVLNIPPVAMTTTLRTEQMTGQETFTIGGVNNFFAPIDFEDEPKEKHSHLSLVPEKE